MVSFEKAKTIPIMRIFRLLPILSVLLFCNCTNTQSQMIDKTTVKELDLNRYLGKWYEIARFPHSFEKNLVGVTATYRLKEDGMIEVLNEGFKNSLDGNIRRHSGRLRSRINRNPES